MDDDALTKVALTCPNMEILDVSSCLSLTEAGIASILEVCNQIRNLQFEKCPLIKHIGEGSELPNVEVVSAVGSVINDEGLAVIGSRCSRLLKLNLDFCERVTTDGIQAMVKTCRSLRGIQLKKCLQVSVYSLNSLLLSRGVKWTS
ncbi:F-box/LRR-repeat protein 3-like [Nicotiana tomentosiformis]|uniref:F-box/LRR-repeat protein 3-like n=1 Tax=Nicotiana tomentosiformis TaxID=4098 RepID=UPI0014485EA9|nr:F-box/LRR-repeat protein 20-like [Nicotiana tomentosiformis]